MQLTPTEKVLLGSRRIKTMTMLASEFIEQIKAFMEKHGDLPLGFVGHPGKRWCPAEEAWVFYEDLPLKDSSESNPSSFVPNPRIMISI